MRLRRRGDLGPPNGRSPLPRRGAARQAPSGAVTSWLRQGLVNGMCPLCRVAHKADREYIWHFYDERSNDMAAVEEVRRAFGFCAEHMDMLRRIDVEDMKTTLSISALLADTFAGIVEELEGLSPDAAFEPAQCPACASREGYLHRNALYLLDMLASTAGYRNTFEASAGLCFPHFQADLAARSDTERSRAAAISAARGHAVLPVIPAGARSEVAPRKPRAGRADTSPAGRPGCCARGRQCG